MRCARTKHSPQRAKHRPLNNPDRIFAPSLNKIHVKEHPTIPVHPQIKALVFDCDGTLADSMPKHFEAWQTTLAAHDLPFPEDLFYELGGVSAPQIIRILNERFGKAVDPISVAEEKEALARELLKEVAPIPVVVRTAEEYHGILPMAVASGGDLPTVSNTLKYLGIAHLFDAVVTSDQIERPKPAPDTFLEAARRLGVEPPNCQVFEDTDTGLLAAKRAGMAGTDIRSYLQGQ